MYAIRNTKNPNVYFHLGVGGSHKKATQIDRFVEGAVPRLFARKRDAIYALDQWLSGRLEKVERPDLPCGFEMRLQYQPGRNRDDWEIIEVEIKPRVANDEGKVIHQ